MLQVKVIVEKFDILLVMMEALNLTFVGVRDYKNLLKKGKDYSNTHLSLEKGFRRKNKLTICLRSVNFKVNYCN